jgi:hypothetical protein
MNEANFFISAVCIFMLGCTVLGTVSGHLEDQKIVQMVQAGADPMRAGCSLNLTTSRSICDEVLK